jgi:hypothetical protein
MDTDGMLAEEEVTIPNLVQLFEQAFFKTEVDGDGDIVVHTDGPRVCVRLPEGKQLVKLFALYGLKSARLEQKHALVNRMNDDFVLVRFSIPDQHPEILMADYYLPFDRGIGSFQIISSLRRFAGVVVAAIKKCDNEDIVA